MSGDPDPTLRGRLPPVFPLYDDSMEFEPWLDAHQAELDALDSDLAQVKDQIHIGTATGQELDLIGNEYGILGQRRGRNDASYRAYLTSLVASFQGVGTIPGVKQAVSSGLLVDESAVEVLEDFNANKYEIGLTNWSAHRTGTVHRLADLADALAIERLDPIHYYSDSTSITLDVDDTIAVGIEHVSTSTSIVLSPGDTTSETVSEPLGDGTLGSGTLGIPPKK